MNKWIIRNSGVRPHGFLAENKDEFRLKQGSDLAASSRQDSMKSQMPRLVRSILVFLCLKVSIMPPFPCSSFSGIKMISFTYVLLRWLQGICPDHCFIASAYCSAWRSVKTHRRDEWGQAATFMCWGSRPARGPSDLAQVEKESYLVPCWASLLRGPAAGLFFFF